MPVVILGSPPTEAVSVKNASAYEQQTRELEKGNLGMGDLLLARGANMSPCGVYRYSLWRTWDDKKPRLPFICLNPSTADANIDDPTIRRCIGFARREKLGGIVVANLFALRATDPQELRRHDIAYGPGNYKALLDFMHDALIENMAIVCAWGASEHARGQGAWRITNLMKSEGCRGICLGKTRDGSPRHPLYVSAGQPFEEFTP